MKTILFLILGLGVVRGSIVSIDVYQNDKGWNYSYQMPSENLNSFTIILPEASNIEEYIVGESTNALNLSFQANSRFVWFGDLQFNSPTANFTITTSTPPTEGWLMTKRNGKFYRERIKVPSVPEPKIILLTILGMIFKPRKRK